MAETELEFIDDVDDFSRRVQGMGVDVDNGDISTDKAVVLSSGHDGLLGFAEDAFPTASIDEIYAKHYEREPEGRGAHFDVYRDLLDPEYPWLAVYNLAGRVSLRALKLPDELAESYFKRFPFPSSAAFKARRDYSSIALNSTEDEDIYTATLDAGDDMVIAQYADGPHIIHEIVPENPSDPGEFIKLVVPRDGESQVLIEEDDMVPLDKLATSALTNQAQRAPKLSPTPPRSRDPIDTRGACGPGMLD